jgi:hypothetical protein
MDVEIQKKLREKFDTAQVGKKPQYTCKACKDARDKVCQQHKKIRCPESPKGCGQWITEKHMHVDFVGHANVTHRLLEVDPEWTWEPMAFGQNGLPALDGNGGLWIRLTVAGVTRIGYGAAEGKTGENAIKEAIGDAIKIAAMRFGVGLDLWRKEEASGKEPDEPTPIGRGEAPQNGHRSAASAAQMQDTAAAARKALAAKCEAMGYDRDAVAAKFREKYQQELGEATDPTRVRAFTKLLDGMPELDLKATA